MKKFLLAITIVISVVQAGRYVLAEPCPITKRNCDLNNDKFVDMLDYAALADDWLDTNCEDSNWCDCSDLDLSGKVDTNDLGLFVDKYLTGIFNGTIILGRPTDSNITANVLSGDNLEIYFEHGTTPGLYTAQTDVNTIATGIPFEKIFENLQADTRYYYRMNFRQVGETEFLAGPEYTFHTQRAPGSTFTFGIQGDSHPEREGKAFDPDLYIRTMLAVAADEPDFYILMGDDFSIDKLDPCTVTEEQVVERYTIQLPYLGTIANSTPLFLVNGNHEQAARYLLDGTPNSVSVWAQNARNRHYPQPAPDGFYTGNLEPVEHIGLLRNYFAWTWGDALFVTIDPYWSSPVVVNGHFYGGPKTTDKWLITHGDTQYQWLKQTLEQSTAKWKFVFAHHVLGTSRGGLKVADLYEWGGYNSEEVWEFDIKRPDWDLPIHDLMAQNGVTIFFQGHDHIFAKEQLDGVIYQTTPYPADPNYSLNNADHYPSADKLPDSGYVSVTVSDPNVTVNYIRTYLPEDENDVRVNGQVAYTYTITKP